MNAGHALVGGWTLVVCAVGMATAQTDWIMEPETPIFEVGPEGSWDDAERVLNTVIKVGDVYHMFFLGRRERWWSTDPGIGHATSMDGISWQFDTSNPVLRAGADGEWDVVLGPSAAVIHDESGFRMWYSGSSPDGWYSWRGGYATSPDGTTWTKHPGNPVFDVGSPGSFDELGVAPQAVIEHDGLYRMWYLANSESDFGIPMWLCGYAESDDGLSWTRSPDPVLEPGPRDNGSFTSLSAVFDGSRYHMWYSGDLAWGLTFNGYAASDDGLQWTKYTRSFVVRRNLPWAGIFIWDVAHQSVLYKEDEGVFEMWFSPYSGIQYDTAYRATSECCSLMYNWIVPAAAYGAGAMGAFFETSVELSNVGNVAAEYRVAWLPRGVSNLEWRWSGIETVGPGATTRFENVLAEVFGLEPNVFGALVVEASSEDLLAMGRISVTRGGKAAGTYGQSMPAIRMDDFIALGDRRRILFGSEDEATRFNVTCQSTYEWDVPIQLELFDAAGSSLGTRTMILGPWGNDQLYRIFRGHLPITGAVDVWTDRGGGSFYCFGSLLDNLTSDPTTIPPM